MNFKLLIIALVKTLLVFTGAGIGIVVIGWLCFNTHFLLYVLIILVVGFAFILTRDFYIDAKKKEPIKESGGGVVG